MSFSSTSRPRRNIIVWRISITVSLSLILVLLLAQRLPARSTNVVLTSFTATTLRGLPEAFIDWETATEFEIVGFFVARGDNAGGTFTRVSNFIPHEGDTVVGAQYQFTDDTTVLSQTYYYRLEVINTDQTVDYYGPISVTAGVPSPSAIFTVHFPLIVRTN